MENKIPKFKVSAMEYSKEAINQANTIESIINHIWNEYKPTKFQKKIMELMRDEGINVREICLNLNKRQMEAFPHLKWITDQEGSRRSEKTYLVACLYIEEALKTQDWVYPTELIHNKDYRANRDLLEQIFRILENNEVPYRRDLSHLGFRIGS
jgi:tetrahydromethanopterin S-methyltransferase subunit G